jgi:5'-AMP-activated protein kinase catalytic alpha subunit
MFNYNKIIMGKKVTLESVGNYALGKTLGKGTFGLVRLGKHIVTGDHVAVKILDKKKIEELGDHGRVANELKILK